MAKALVVEDQDQMARLILSHLMALGFERVDISTNAQDAVERLSAARRNPYELIICDYNLGDGTNGQQLLELLRHDRRIPNATSFIMVTAESSYAQVASAVELVPDAYLLKPFTVDALEQRVQYARAKRDALKDAYAALDLPEPDYDTAIQACSKLIVERNRFALEALKVRGETLLKKQNWSEAHSVFEKVMAWRATPWAEVGRAKALRGAGYPEKALEKLKASIESFPQFVPAYDELATLVNDNGDKKLAQKILEQAHKIVPSNRRTRQLGLMALENGDHDNAARWLKIVTERDRYGMLRSTEDFFGLVKAQSELKRFEHALETLESLKDHFPMTPVLGLRKTAAEVKALASSGRKNDARKKIKDALEGMDPRTPPQAQLELAEACYAAGEESQGRDLLVHVAENWNESEKVVDRVKGAFANIGRVEEGERIVRNSREQLVEINNQAIRLVKAERLDEAIALIEDVAARLTDNATVQANAAHALLAWLEHNRPPNLMSLPLSSKPRIYVGRARDHLKHLAGAKSNHPRLGPLYRQFMKLTGETIYGLEGLVPLEDEPVEAVSDGLQHHEEASAATSPETAVAAQVESEAAPAVE